MRNTVHHIYRDPHQHAGFPRSMARNFNEQFGPKWVEVVIVGERLSAGRASEIIRRTDVGFCRQVFPVSEYGQTARAMVGFPNSPESNSDRLGANRDIACWRALWGGIDLHWLHNAQLLHGIGWCHADGTIAFARELEDYPRACHLLEDCQLLATTFPDLVMHVAAWGEEQTILGSPLEDAPRSPWPQTLLDSLTDPTLGFLIEEGKVDVVTGSNPWLFKRFGLDCPRAVEWAVSESHRCTSELVRDTEFGDRGYYSGLPMTYFTIGIGRRERSGWWTTAWRDNWYWGWQQQENCFRRQLSLKNPPRGSTRRQMSASSLVSRFETGTKASIMANGHIEQT
ncbi:MAG: hypothetical protein R3E50_07085 [Halioglobus sp.]